MDLTRRRFLQTGSIALGGLALGSFVSFRSALAAQPMPALSVADLPKGASPPPVAFPHFPDRLHAFVWRNWPLVPARRMAKVVGARAGDIERMGRAMGLGPQSRITADQQRRSYITVIKRNWHLLPYDQLLTLLGWTPQKLAYTLREDDFLYVKLGNLKPQCEPLRYQAPDAVTLSREAEICRIMREEIRQQGAAPSEPLFGFVRWLSERPGSAAAVAASGQLKFCYSYFALYGDPLLQPDADPYPDGYLARLAQVGVNGVWLQAVLYKLAPFPWEPALSDQYQLRLASLQRLVARARKYGIKVFLYLNEPRAMPIKFFDGREQLKGVTEGDHSALCTSAPAVQSYLSASVAGICRAVPDLGGFFTITASENLTNCWSHGNGSACPHCGRRAPADVIAEINRLLFDGIRASGSACRLIAWDWGWEDAWAGEAISRLPSEIALMSVSEWRLPLDRGGVRSEVGEYSISAVGPGPRAEQHWKWAKEHGLKTLAKIQAGNTWELSAVPYIPAIQNVAQHAENLQKAGINNLMLGWTLGGYPSPNLDVVCETLACGSADEAIRRVAQRRFGPTLAPSMISAWHEFSLAFSQFPFHVGVLYSGPQQLGPANLLWAGPTGYHASMVGFPYDDLDAWRAVYPAEVFMAQLDKVAEGFMRALQQLRDSIAASHSGVSALQRQALEEECRVAEAVAIHFRSAANQVRFVLARRAMAAAKSSADRSTSAPTLERVLKDEIALARRLYELQSGDSRLGFEASNHYFYVPVDLAEKVLNCRYLLAHWLPGAA